METRIRASRRWWLAEVVLLGLAVTPLTSAAFASAEVAPVGALLSGVNVLGQGFSSPTSVATDSTHVWVANQTANSVTELNAATGALIQVIKGATYGFNGSTAITVDDTNVWVANYLGNSISEFPYS